MFFLLCRPLKSDLLALVVVLPHQLKKTRCVNNCNMFILAKLRNREILELSSGHIEICKFFKERGVSLPKHASLRMIQILAHGLYSDLEN